MALTLLRERKKSSPLIEILAGETYIRATTSKTPIFWQGQTWWPEPTIDVKLPKQSGGLSEDPCKLTLPLNRPLHPPLLSFALSLSKPRAAPRARVRVINLLQAAEEDFTPVFLYEGILDRVNRNPEGKKNQIELEFQTELRYQLGEISLGRRADPECDHIYGKNGCFVDNTQFFSLSDNWPNNYKKIRRAWVIASVSSQSFSREVTVSLDPAMHPGMDNRTISDQPRGWWVRSFFEKNTVRIPVQEWFWNETGNTGTLTFVLNRIPPEDWNNSRVLLVHGCPQTPEACKDRNPGVSPLPFGGLGFGIPAYNPVFEVRND